LVVLGKSDQLLFGVTNMNVSPIVSWNTAADKDKVERVVNADDVQVLRCDALATHSSGHLLPRPYTPGILKVAKVRIKLNYWIDSKIPDVLRSPQQSGERQKHRDSLVVP
jgi:glycine/D-amino acid oxidase-like deaminating enzyme